MGNGSYLCQKQMESVSITYFPGKEEGLDWPRTEMLSGITHSFWVLLPKL